MNYLEAQNYIEEKSRLGIVPGLTQVKELLRRLGNPQDACRTLHIAGTNGKGSIFAFVQESLLAAGYHVGRYISPTILTYLERYQLDRRYMTEDEFAVLLTEVAAVIETMETDGFASPTVFEIETAVAFLYFARNHLTMYCSNVAWVEAKMRRMCLLNRRFVCLHRSAWIICSS